MGIAYELAKGCQAEGKKTIHTVSNYSFELGSEIWTFIAVQIYFVDCLFLKYYAFTIVHFINWIDKTRSEFVGQNNTALSRHVPSKLGKRAISYSTTNLQLYLVCLVSYTSISSTSPFISSTSHSPNPTTTYKMLHLFDLVQLQHSSWCWPLKANNDRLPE